MKGPGWPFVQPFNRKRNGLAAFSKSQAEGRSAIATWKAKACAMATSTTAIFTGKGKLNFDQNVANHQQAYNKLMFLEEPVVETKKVTDFLAGICDPKLKTAIQTCLGDEQKLTSFELCQSVLQNGSGEHQDQDKVALQHPRDCQVGIVKDKDKEKAKQKKSKFNNNDKLPCGIGWAVFC